MQLSSTIPLFTLLATLSLTTAAPLTTVTTPSPISTLFPPTSSNNNITKREVACNVVPNDKMRKNEAVIANLLLATQGDDIITVPKGGVDVVTQPSGRFWVYTSGVGGSMVFKPMFNE
ncbi:hypothetical protein B0T20DRAFT_484084 [Sordaria brevicollis]|uniref:Uncharacterized protein n=1 Tax=Sordaria brevicollis TaxID=83679 RepID=A0AAE0NVN1_SORBR|nr:hypothetical protein B0T20DRAFT_484084 [Sordaria brevicollis]